MIRGHVGSHEIILWFKLDENLTHEDWERLLDELKSHSIPGLYQTGKRSHATFESASGTTRVVIYLTDRTVTPHEAKAILRKWRIELSDEYGIAI